MRALPIRGDAFLHRIGLGGLYLLGLLLLALLLLAAVEAPRAALLLPAVLVALPVAIWLFKRPLLNLSVLLGGFVLIAAHTQSIGVGEVVYGAYWLAFITHWFVTRAFIYHTPIVPDLPSKALVLFLIGVTLSSGIALLLGTPVAYVASQLRSVLMLTVFFPTYEAVVRYKHALPLLIWVVAGTWCFIALRNMLNYQAVIANALYTYQVGRGRVVSNDDILMAASTCLLTWTLFASQARARVVLLLAFVLCFSALVLTQSRSYWAAFMLTAILLFLIAPPSKRSVLVLATGGGLLTMGVLASALMGDRFGLMLLGFVNRLGTISSAGVADISLLSRYYEAQGALSAFARNPILGHGPGTVFSHWDILTHTTRQTNFIHNAYVSLLFKHGIWGTGLVLTVWFSCIYAGFKAYWNTNARAVTRVTGLGAALTLTGFLLSQIAAPLLTLDDSTFNVAVLMGFAAGAYRRGMAEVPS